MGPACKLTKMSIVNFYKDLNNQICHQHPHSNTCADRWINLLTVNINEIDYR